MEAACFSLIDVTLGYVTEMGSGVQGIKGAARLAQLLRLAGINAVDLGELTNPLRFELTHQLGLLAPDLDVMVQCRLDRRQLTSVAEALKTSRNGRLGLLVPTGPDAVQGKRWQAYSDVLAAIEDYVGFGRRLGLRMEVVLENASTTEPVFLGRVAQKAVSAGAAGITLVESGLLVVEQFAGLVRQVKRAVPGTPLGVRCSNSQRLAVSLVVGALDEGVTEVGSLVTDWAERLPCPALDKLAGAGLVDIAPQLMAQLCGETHAMLGSVQKMTGYAAPGKMAP